MPRADAVRSAPPLRASLSLPALQEPQLPATAGVQFGSSSVAHGVFFGRSGGCSGVGSPRAHSPRAFVVMQAQAAATAVHSSEGGCASQGGGASTPMPSASSTAAVATACSTTAVHSAPQQRCASLQGMCPTAVPQARGRARATAAAAGSPTSTLVAATATATALPSPAALAQQHAVALAGLQNLAPMAGGAGSPRSAVGTHPGATTVPSWRFTPQCARPVTPALLRSCRQVQQDATRGRSPSPTLTAHSDAPVQTL